MEDQINFESRIDFTDLNEKITRIRERMGKVIIGQKEVADLLLTAINRSHRVIGLILSLLLRLGIIYLWFSGERKKSKFVSELPCLKNCWKI